MPYCELNRESVNPLTSNQPAYLRAMNRVASMFVCAVLLSCGSDQDVVREVPDARSEMAQYAEGFDFITYGDVRCLRLYDLERRDGTVHCTVCTAHPAPEGAIVLPEGAPRIALVSTTHLSLFAAADALDVLVGTAYADRIMHPAGQAAIHAGTIKDLSGENDLNTERTLAVQPDLVTTYPFGGRQYPVFEQAGIALIPLSEYLETHPLGRAEWMVAAGFLAGREHPAREAFIRVRDAYLALTTLTDALDDDQRPVIFTGSHANGKWYAPPGNSFMGAFSRDAGGRYLFDDIHQEGNLTLDFETFMVRAAGADLWGRVVYAPGAVTPEALLAEDPRYASLKAYKTGNVFYCNAAETDYFGDAIVAPHHVLADLVAILHPHLQPGHRFRYFKPVAF